MVIWLELSDGSLWKIAEAGPETLGFSREEIDFCANQIIGTWKPGDTIVVHKVTDRMVDDDDETILFYNETQQQLFDFVPFLPPLRPQLKVVNVDFDNKVISLSDNSVWKFKKYCSCEDWEVGDPILVAKDTPWENVWSTTNTHMIINLASCECDSTVEHIHTKRVGAVRVQ